VGYHVHDVPNLEFILPSLSLNITYHLLFVSLTLSKHYFIRILRHYTRLLLNLFKILLHIHHLEKSLSFVVEIIFLCEVRY
jgi:hypothetical protein